MNRRLALLSLFVLALAVPLSASQFVPMEFDKLARGSKMVVRATVGPVTSAWDDAHEIIFSSANLEVHRYLAGNGPKVLRIREAGGTVGNYTMEAVGFPVLREGQEVVLFLSKWEDSDDWRIEGFNEGKYVVRGLRDGAELVAHDPETQGHAREAAQTLRPAANDAVSVRELELMIYDARIAPERDKQ